MAVLLSNFYMLSTHIINIISNKCILLLNLILIAFLLYHILIVVLSVALRVLASI